MFFAGWDGGATKTAVRLVDESGSFLSESAFGPMNLNGVPAEIVRQSITDGVSRMAQGPGGINACGGLVIGVAGVSNASVRSEIEADVRNAGFSGPLKLLGDQEIALHGAIRGAGAVLIAGTGSVCFGLAPDGAFFRTGGRGHLIDDGGSGYAIGRDILSAVIRAEDGRLPPTCLTGLVYQALGIDSPEGIVTWIYAPTTGKKEVAALAPLLLEALEQNDDAADAIRQKAIRDLVDMVTAAWKKAGMTGGGLALTGSILQRFSAIRQGVISSLNSALPALQVGDPRGTPAEGAASLALQLFGGAGENG